MNSSVTLLKKIIAIRCISDHSRGYGHFSRSIAISNYFSKKKYEVIFFINNDLIDELKKRKIKHIVLPKFKTKNSEINYLKKISIKKNISCLIIDMREFSENISKELKNLDCLIAVIDDSSVKNVYSDIILNGTPIRKYHKYKRSNKKSKLLLGLQYFITNLEFLENKKKLSDIKLKEKYNVVISCGGSDVNNLTWKITNQIIDLDNVNIQVIIGPLMDKNNIPKKMKSIKIYESPKKIWKIFNQADLVICTSGSTLFELAIQGIPCINISTEYHQIPYGLEFSKLGFGKYMGHWDEIDYTNLKFVSEKILLNVKYRKEMSSKGKNLVDGKGLQRFEKTVRSSIYQ